MKDLLQRLTTGWTFSRAFYVLMGGVIIVQAALAQQWLGVFFGGYFASMGLFSFGCASGSCFGGTCTTTPQTQNKKDIQDVTFEEIKSE